jgi:hypothetical protein
VPCPSDSELRHSNPAHSGKESKSKDEISTKSIVLISADLTIILAFRALLRNSGLLVGLGIAGVAAYQGIRDAMAENTSSPHGHLDATGSREVVFCHQCEHEWWQDEYGLTCPRCESDITEIVCFSGLRSGSS